MAFRVSGCEASQSRSAASEEWSAFLLDCSMGSREKKKRWTGAFTPGSASDDG